MNKVQGRLVGGSEGRASMSNGGELTDREAKRVEAGTSLLDDKMAFSYS